MDDLRALLKRVLPAPVRTAIRLPLTYARRLSTWRAILATMRGETIDDQRILRRSARAALLNSLRQAGEWQDPQLLGDASVAVAGIGRFTLRAESDDLYHVLPAREPAVLAAIRTTLKVGDLFIDAGANIGVFTVLAGNIVGAGGRVVAIEMIPATAKLLRHHIALNALGNVSVIERALSDRAGEQITASIPDGRFGQASIVGNPRGTSVTVETTTLDAALDDFAGPIALIKLDLEGAEAKACAGAIATLHRTRAVIFEELGNDRKVVELLNGLGFVIRNLDQHNFIAEK